MEATEYNPLIKRRSVSGNSCWYCSNIEANCIKFVKTVIDDQKRELDAYCTQYHYCPNCGRKIGVVYRNDQT